MTNRQFLKDVVWFLAFIVDEQSARSNPRFAWDDHTNNLDDEIDEISGSSGVCTLYTRRGAVMDVHYYCAPGTDTDEDFFEIMRRSDVGFTEIIHISIAQTLKLRRLYHMGCISKDNAIAMMRGAILLAQ